MRKNFEAYVENIQKMGEYLEKKQVEMYEDKQMQKINKKLDEK